MKLADEVIDFLAETQDYLDNAEPYIIDLRNNPNNSKDSIDILFRSFHSIKGVAGFLGFTNTQKATHCIEETLDFARSGDLQITSEIVDLLLLSVDFLRVILVNIKEHGVDLCDPDVLAHIINCTENLLIEQKTPVSVLDVQLNGDVYPCFKEKTFLEAFHQNLLQTTSSIENELFKLLDTPKDLHELFECVEGHIKTLLTNLRFIDKKRTEEILQYFSKSIKEILKSNAVVKAEVLGNWFATLGWINENGSVTHLSLDAEENLKQIIETYKSETNIQTVSNTKPHVTPPSTTNHDSKSSDDSTQSRGEIRVEMEKMDQFIELIEELSVVSGVVARDTSLKINQDPKLLQATNKLQQITTALQDVAMSVRLVPLTTTTKKITRLVYDVSKKLQKEVNFVIKGEKTELDRNMVEALQDPLVHIFRNAIDHGLELPEERIQKGKSQTGILEFEAWLGGGEILISISDDGKGMDPDFIFNKAVDKGIIDPTTKLTDKEKLQLIFQPGFSTKSEVSDFSGRGVGMDVVKQSILSLDGNIEIDSTFGKGSRFTLALPLMSTIVETLLLRVGNTNYSLRVASIRELFSATRNMLVQTPDGIIHIKLRNQLYQVYHVADILKSRGGIKNENYDEGIFILVENKGNLGVFFVDEILGTNQGVIKNLPLFMKDIQGISGCSVIGTNSNDISWILDTNYIMSSNNQEACS